MQDFVIHVEICEDVWTPVPPSSFGAMAGATILANLSASNIVIGKAQARRDLCRSQSMRCIAAYLYSAAGPGESTTDLAWDGHVAVFENGELLSEGERFADEPQMITADIDLDRLRQERMRVGSFGDCADHHRAQRSFRSVSFALDPPLDEKVPLRRAIDRYPFLPSDPALLDANCYEAFNIQVQGLMTRLAAIGVKKVVLGISGGLDFDPCADRRGASLRSARLRTQGHPLLHLARACDLEADQDERTCADARFRGERARDRHHADRSPDADRDRSSECARASRL